MPMAVVEGSPGDKLVPWSYIGTDSAITLCKATNVCHTYVRDQDPLIISGFFFLQTKVFYLQEMKSI